MLSQPAVAVRTAVVGSHKLCCRDVAVDPEEPGVVEPVEVVQGRGFDLLDGPPRSLAFDELGLEQPITVSSSAFSLVLQP